MEPPRNLFNRQIITQNKFNFNYFSADPDLNSLTRRSALK